MIPIHDHKWPLRSLTFAHDDQFARHPSTASKTIPPPANLSKVLDLSATPHHPGLGSLSSPLPPLNTVDRNFPPKHPVQQRLEQVLRVALSFPLLRTQALGAVSDAGELLLVIPRVIVEFLRDVKVQNLQLIFRQLQIGFEYPRKQLSQLRLELCEKDSLISAIR